MANICQLSPPVSGPESGPRTGPRAWRPRSVRKWLGTGFPGLTFSRFGNFGLGGPKITNGWYNGDILRNHKLRFYGLAVEKNIGK